MPKKTISKKDIVRRLNIICGHTKKVAEMVEDEAYCIDVLQQTSAVKNALKKVEDLLLDKHLHSCVIKAVKKDKSGKAIDEVLEVFKKINK